MNYSDKLKHPKWQKKRLKIFERDDWTCQKCKAIDKTLHCHHLKYEKDKDPWEYEDKYLITLCFECHEKEYEYEKFEKLFIKIENDTLNNKKNDGCKYNFDNDGDVKIYIWNYINNAISLNSNLKEKFTLKEYTEWTISFLFDYLEIECGWTLENTCGCSECKHIFKCFKRNLDEINSKLNSVGYGIIKKKTKK